MDLQDSVQRSLQNPAEKILQICTDSQRSKTWEMHWFDSFKNEKTYNSKVDCFCVASILSDKVGGFTAITLVWTLAFITPEVITKN